MSLLIRNGNIVLPWGVWKGDLLIEEGKIAGIGRGLRGAEETIDASNKIVLPGVIDVHVHMREPGYEYKDNFENGTKDAASGGITTVLEMPNTNPPVDSSKRLLEKKTLLEKKAYVDFGLYGVIHDKNIGEFEKIVDAGAVGFKVFLGPTTGNIPPPSLPTLYEAMIKSSKYDVPLAFHAEEWDLVKYFTEKARETGRKDPEVHIDARPPICEELAIEKIGILARKTGANIYIVHVTSCEAIHALEKYIEDLHVTGETNPHYLLLDVEDYRRYGSIMKVNPPIRGGIHRKCLWDALMKGILSIISSDHAPHNVDEKMKDIWSSASGFPGVRTLLPLIIDQALRGKIPLTMIPRILSLNPAKKFKLYPRKGCIMPGCDADLVVIDPSMEYVFDKEKMFCKNKITPFHGWKLRGLIEYTILRGEVIYSRGEVIDKPLGTFIKPRRSRE
ncbi:MAG: allantoinase [Desulfurococcales archaeon ex4484_58]|nr:MAG: allantoinase [Desulfurococcales archaeon ex4484_58]